MIPSSPDARLAEAQQSRRGFLPPAPAESMTPAALVAQGEHVARMFGPRAEFDLGVARITDYEARLLIYPEGRGFGPCRFFTAPTWPALFQAARDDASREAA